MGQLKIYIKPFDDAGNYLSDFIDVSSDAIFGTAKKIKEQLDNTEYDIGIYRPANFTLKLNNKSGKYSDVDVLESIFRYKREGGQIKVTWRYDENRAVCGQSSGGQVSGSKISPEITIFEGLLSDETLKMDLKTNDVNFRVLGRESVFKNVLVPYSSLSVGDNLSDIIYTCLNQTEITDLLTLDSLNISVGTDAISDAVAPLENETVSNALDKLLFITNSVLYIRESTIYVQPRTPTTDIKYNFYGQSSPNGIENIQEIKNIRTGLARMFNYFVWGTTVVSDSTSITKYGIRKKEINFDVITDTTKKTNILTPIMQEFRSLKQEFDLITPLNYQTEEIELLDRIGIDYPPAITEQENALPICGVAICGADILPNGLFNFIITEDEEYKVLGKSVDYINGLVTLRMRKI